jgi:hypothetical protein
MSRTVLLLCCLLAAGGALADNRDIVAAARQQIGVTTLYDGSYRTLRYPDGDVPAERGVCTDVIVRALRTARSLDLQKLVHEDLVAHRGDYSSRWRNAAGHGRSTPRPRPIYPATSWRGTWVAASCTWASFRTGRRRRARRWWSTTSAPVPARKTSCSGSRSSDTTGRRPLTLSAITGK